MPDATRRRKILHVVLSIGETNAAYNEHCLPMATERDIAICTFFGSNLVPPASIAAFQGDGSLLGFVRVLRTAVNGRKYDVIHAHSPHVGLLFLLARLLGIIRSSAATVITVHDSYPNYKVRNRLLLLPVFAGFDRVVCCSNSSLRSFPTIYRFLAGRRLCAIQNGLDIARIDKIACTDRSKRVDSGQFTVISIGRLVGIKNPSAVLAAFQESADEKSRLLLVGEGPLQASLTAASSARHLEKQVVFTGLISRDRVYEHLFRASLFVSASRGEGLPVSVLEAMACSCPVLLSDIAPHREVSEGADFIPLIEPGDLAGLAREIARFRTMPFSEREAVGHRCRQLVEKRFDLRIMHAQYAEIYNQVMRVS
jgi:glycosyltransferase involved in cell wall biosynthesis